jgi:hypothetical protein
LSGLEVPLLGRDVEGRPPVLSGSIDVGAALDEDLHDRTLADGCRVVEWRAARIGPHPNFRAARQEKPGSGRSTPGRRRVERGDAAGVSVVHPGAAVERRADRLQVTGLGSLSEVSTDIALPVQAKFAA